MNNAVSILLMFLVAALNTIVIVIVVRLIFKIKVDKQKLKEELKKEAMAELKKGEVLLKKNTIMKEVKSVEEKTTKPKVEENSAQTKPKTEFLKYTPKGYVIPGHEKQKTHLWR